MISKNGIPIYQKSHGYIDLIKKTSLKTYDQFLIGSISKQFTATLVLMEIQAGRIQAHQSIHYYLPGLKQRWADGAGLMRVLRKKLLVK
jgi:D-alanyl-D-alanine carboxypeptidase